MYVCMHACSMHAWDACRNPSTLWRRAGSGRQKGILQFTPRQCSKGRKHTPRAIYYIYTSMANTFRCVILLQKHDQTPLAEGDANIVGIEAVLVYRDVGFIFCVHCCCSRGRGVVSILRQSSTFAHSHYCSCWRTLNCRYWYFWWWPFGDRKFIGSFWRYDMDFPEVVNTERDDDTGFSV